MSIQIYNTLSRRKEPFEPLDPPRVTIYNCGPTVYDRFHIGNARNFVVMDMVRRYLQYRGYDVRFVQNLTDIDDKIINRANEEGVSAEDITARYIPRYYEDAEKLGIRAASAHPRATEHIEDIVELIGRLVERDLAYAAGGSVYFRVGAWKEYGKLSGRDPKDLLEGARVEVSEEKEHAADFVLWKAARPGEPRWPSPWGEGRPGWHIECSAMAMKHLGETIDIHAGGTDLTFPHHENEIAQSEGATGRPFARYWMHNGFLNIDSEKMSKSLGNFLKIDQVLEHNSRAAVRHFLLSAHYRAPLDMTPEALGYSASAVRRVRDALQTGRQVLSLEGAEPRAGDTPEIRQMRERFEAAMDDDFNTPRAMAVMFDAVTAIHAARRASPPEVQRLASLVALLRELVEFFSFEEDEAAAAGGDDELVGQLIELLIDARKQARKARAFEIADRIRDRLGELGIALEDHPQGTIWKRQ